MPQSQQEKQKLHNNGIERLTKSPFHKYVEYLESNISKPASKLAKKPVK